MSLNENLLKVPGNFNTAIVYVILKLAHYMPQFLLDRKLEGGFLGGVLSQDKRIKGIKAISSTRNRKSKGQIYQEEIMNRGRLGPGDPRSE